jgi:serine/threonine-protein kinase RsbW
MGWQFPVLDAPFLCEIGVMYDNGLELSHVVVIASDPVEAERVQAAIERDLQSYDFAEREIFGIRLALEEALVNAIKHGNQMDRTKKIHVSYRISADVFEIRITDEGEGFDPEDVADPLAPENLERPSGRGLLHMRQYMSEVVFHPPGNHLSMRKVRGLAERPNGK